MTSAGAAAAAESKDRELDRALFQAVYSHSIAAVRTVLKTPGALERLDRSYREPNERSTVPTLLARLQDSQPTLLPLWDIVEALVLVGFSPNSACAPLATESGPQPTFACDEHWTVLSHLLGTLVKVDEEELIERVEFLLQHGLVLNSPHGCQTVRTGDHPDIACR